MDATRPTIQETWQEERVRKTEELRRMTEGIAAALGDGWAADPFENGEDWRARIRKGGENGPELFLSNSWAGKGRLHVGGSFPHGNGGTYHPRDEKHSITVALDRPPAAVAKEIARRLLPAYLEAFRIAAGQKAKDEEAQQNALALARQIGALLGDSRLEGAGESVERRRSERSFTLYGSGIQAEVSAYGSARLKVDTSSPEEALAIVKAILALRVAS